MDTEKLKELLLGQIRWPNEIMWTDEQQAKQGWLAIVSHSDLRALIAELEQARKDAGRLDALQAYVDEHGGIVLHNGTHGGGPYCGLGLANTNRTLREAVSELSHYEGAMEAQP